MYRPLSTYRVQLHQDYSLKKLSAQLDYLQKLGIRTIYGSPILQSRAGSQHGYDGIDPTRIDPELGTQDEWEQLHRELQQRGMGWLQDIVPNHLAYSSQNPLIRDVFEKGPLSEFYQYFDINWQHPNAEFSGKVMVPILGKDEGEALTDGELQLTYADGELQLAYYEHQFPLQPESYFLWLGDDAYRFEQVYRWMGSTRMALESKDVELWDLLKKRLWEFWEEDDAFRAYGTERLEQLNQNGAILREVLEQQHFRLCYWPLSNMVMNYRRFFTVNDLICLNIHEPSVFEHYHQWVLGEVKAGRIQGLRVDHIDGLYDPTAYVQVLRKSAGEETILLAEKILERDEQLPATWPIDGTTGYEFTSRINKLLTYEGGEKTLDQLYTELTGQQPDWEDLVYEKKRHILHHHMVGEWDNLYHLFQELEWIPQLEQEQLGEEALYLMIGELLLAMPVYRIYPRSLPLSGPDRDLIAEVLASIRKRNPELTTVAERYEAAFVRDEFASEQQRKVGSKFLRRAMQFSGPLMAKGLEDTTFYLYNRFIAHNEVGDDPSQFHLAQAEFEHFIQQRQKTHPLSLNTLSTHDTKRGEDTRARLFVLSELYLDWKSLVEAWQPQWSVAGVEPNDAYFLAQTLAGAWPMDGEPDEAFAERLKGYLPKALREAKVKSDWGNPNEEYEQAVIALALDSLKPESAFRQAFDPLFPKLRDYGIVNSLSQVLLKNTLPGTPDLYQGSESWNLSLVDPDNRRPVDYDTLSQQLAQIDGWLEEDKWEEKLWENRSEGQVKLWLTQACLRARQDYPELFSDGEYVPIEVKGTHSQHVMAYFRRQGKDYALVVLPLHSAILTEGKAKRITKIDWQDTRLVLPKLAPHDWQDQFSSKSHSCWDELPLKDLMGQLPFALLTGSRSSNGRKAGVLLHISSLPTAYGIGDMGPHATKFVDWLAESGQTLWQVLPLNPVTREGYYSPYAADSAFAGNPMLISPDLLEEMGLVTMEHLAKHWLEASGPVDFIEVEARKTLLLQQAYQTFRSTPDSNLREQFEAFCQAESDWLDDYALYRVLRQHFEGKPWSEWPEKIRHRDAEKLIKKREKFAQEIEAECFTQFIFQLQWQGLRQYAHRRDVEIFGDMPIYVSYDSADVWAHPELFKLDDNLAPKTVAGVPPDYFSETGQLWGMPIFDWSTHEMSGYQWWIQRVRRNLEFFDLLRLDHFRAFAAYWQVPASEKTAINGRWSPGPGRKLFDALQEALGTLPIVAEDLGDIDQEVYDLRDAYHFPGMRVMQFAFSPNMPQNLHIPHLYTPNSVAYTGTHDNNTLKGWHQHELDEAAHRRLEAYLGHAIKPELLHWEMIRLLYASTAETIVVPMQDIMGLGQSAMMNKPGTVKKNWKWRMENWPPTDALAETLQQLVKVYGR